MKRYKSSREVNAAKIETVVTACMNQSENVLITESGHIYVSDSYIEKHQPHDGGYYIKYDDGYESFCPCESFESGYSVVESTAKTER